MRKIKEFFRPSLKCKRIGHVSVEASRKIRTDGNYQYAAIDYKQTYIKCSRCGKFIKEVSREKLDCWNGCKMPTYMWDEIRANGYRVL